MNLKEYIEWLRSKGVQDDDTIIFSQDDGSGYVMEFSDVPIIEEYKPRRHWEWEKEPKWILGTGTR